MKNRRGTIAAITAAVAAYLEEEEKALAPALAQPRPAMGPNLWAICGREEMMRMRTLWQRRIAFR